MLGLNPGFYARNVTADTLAGRPLMAVVNQQGQLESGVVASADGQHSTIQLLKLQNPADDGGDPERG